MNETKSPSSVFITCHPQAQQHQHHQQQPIKERNTSKLKRRQLRRKKLTQGSLFKMLRNDSSETVVPNLLGPADLLNLY